MELLIDILIRQEQKINNIYLKDILKMLQVTDKKVLEWTNGKIESVSMRKNTKNSINDPDIFGKMEEGSLSIGHLSLPAPIVNIQYVSGEKPVLANIIGLNQKETESIVHYKQFINLNPESDDYKNIVTHKEYDKLVNKKDYKTGSQAIKELVSDNEQKDCILLNYLPVIPIIARYAIDEENKFYPLHINSLYERIVLEINRVERLKKMEAPYRFIHHELMWLQDLADHLINNGAYGAPIFAKKGIPAASFSDLYTYIYEKTI